MDEVKEEIVKNNFVSIMNKKIEDMTDKEWDLWLKSYIDNLHKIKKVSIRDFFKGF